jgi:hypothetical protein
MKNPALDETVDAMEDFVTSRRSRYLTQPLLVSLITTAFFAILCILLDTLLQRSTFIAFIPFLFAVTLESIFTEYWLQRPERRLLNHAAYRASEFLFIFLSLRLYTLLVVGNNLRWEFAADYLRRPYLLVSDSTFIGALFFTLGAWFVAGASIRLFLELVVDRAEVYYYSLPINQRDFGGRPAPLNRQAIVQTIMQNWIYGGVALAFATAVISIDPMNVNNLADIFGISRLNLSPLHILALLIYFMAGFALISHAKLMALNARWLHEGVQKNPRLERNWHRYTLALLLGIGFIALFLPLGSTFLIGSLIQLILTLIANTIAFISLLLIALASMLFTPATDPSEVQPELLPTEIPPPLIPTPEAPPPPVAVSDTASIIASSAFWAVAIVMTIIALSFFLRDRGLRLNTTLLHQIWALFRDWLRQFWADIQEQVSDFQEGVREWRQPKAEDEPPTAPPWRFVRLNSLSPREQVRYFYLSTVKRASDQGAPRSDAETPLEYAEDLKEQWPDADAEIDELTQAFLKARYSPEEIAPEEVNPIKQQWKQVKASLRKRKTKHDE